MKKLSNITILVGILTFFLVIGAQAAATIAATQVTYNDTTVKAKVDELVSNANTGKTQIATAITNKGVSTSADASFETMAANIGKIQTDSPLKVIDLGGTTSSINVKTVCANNGIDYTKLTVNNFAIYKVTGSSPSKSGIMFGYKVGSGTLTLSGGTPSISYNASTGVVSVSGCSESAVLTDSSGNSAQNETVSRTLTAYVRLVY